MKDGKIFYQGPVNEIIPFYEIRGRNCPENYNPSDFVMNLCQSESVEDLEKNNLFMTMPDLFHSDDNLKSTNLESENLHFQSESSVLKQLLVISYREGVNFFRDIPSLVARAGVTIILTLIYGLIFLNIGNKDVGNLNNFETHVGAISMLTISSLFGSGQSVLLGFPFERPMILREYVTGTYGIVAYFVSKLFVEIPVTFAQMLLQWIIAYNMINLQGNFIFHVLISFGLGMVSNSIAMGLGCLIPDVKDVTELAPLAYVPQVLFAGFFIRTSQIPVFMRWAQYLCGMKYAMNLALLNEFRETSDLCQKSEAANRNCKSVIELNNINPEEFYVYILILVAIFAIFRVLGCLVLSQKAKRFY